MAVFFLTSGCFPNMVGHISVSYVNIARIPFSELEADLALRCSFLFQLQFFYLLPKAGILLFILILFVSFVHHYRQGIGRSSSQFPMFSKRLFLILLCFDTLEITIQA